MVVRRKSKRTKRRGKGSKKLTKKLTKNFNQIHKMASITYNTLVSEMMQSLVMQLGRQHGFDGAEAVTDCAFAQVVRAGEVHRQVCWIVGLGCGCGYGGSVVQRGITYNICAKASVKRHN